MKKLFILSTASVFCLYSCVIDFVYTFQVINYSNESQTFCYTCSDSLKSEMDSLAFDSYFTRFDHVDRYSYTWTKNSFKREKLTHHCEDNRIRFFFISDYVFSNNPWDTIVKYQMYNKKLVFSEDD